MLQLVESQPYPTRGWTLPTSNSEVLIEQEMMTGSSVLGAWSITFSYSREDLDRLALCPNPLLAVPNKAIVDNIVDNIWYH